MRKIVLALVLLGCVFSAGAQKYTVVHISGGDCQVNLGNGWNKLCVNATLGANAVLKNTRTPLSEVVLRESGTQNTYRVYMLAEQFELSRFVTDKEKGKPTGELQNFSGFVKDMIRSSQAIMINVEYGDKGGATHRNASESFVYVADDFVRCIAGMAGGKIDVSGPLSLSNGHSVVADYDGQEVTLTNYGDETVNCYLIALSNMFKMGLVPVDVVGNNLLSLPSGCEVKVPYKKTEDIEKLLLISSEESAKFCTRSLSGYLTPMMGQLENPVPFPENPVPFSISTF